MRLGGRLAAAIEVLENLEERSQPASVALAEWGRAHRFAGSGDRAVIGNLVYDALRQRRSLAWRAGGESVAHLVHAVARYGWQISDLPAALADDRFAPDLPELADRLLGEAEPAIQADVPEWLWSAFDANFGDEAIAEGQALAQRPPTDLRANTLKATTEKVHKALRRFEPSAGQLVDTCLRLAAPEGPGRQAHVLSQEAFQKGWCEVQDQGSQAVAALVYAQAGEQVLDLCAGAGGKTLALAAHMKNQGQIYAYDRDQRRMAPIYERLQRAGVRNTTVIASDDRESLTGLTGRMDRVLVDAPCTGSGVWRRRPDAKWRLTETALSERIGEQEAVLEEAAQYVKPGGYLCYVTCSILPSENEDQVAAFLVSNPAFELVSVSEVWESLFEGKHGAPWSADGYAVTLTPAATGTDGFFFAVMERRDQA